MKGLKHMFRTIAALVVALSCSIQAIAGDPLDASVRVGHSDGIYNHLGSGTVVAVENGLSLILTNQHVAPANANYYVNWPNGKRTAARWLAADAASDLAAVYTVAPYDVEPCPPSAKPPTAGDELLQVGYPGMKGRISRTGQLKPYDGATLTYTLARVLKAEIPTESGDSGSGAFINGELVGVIWGGHAEHDTGCSIVAHEDIYRFLNRTDAVYNAFPEFAKKLGRTPQWVRYGADWKWWDGSKFTTPEVK